MKNKTTKGEKRMKKQIVFMGLMGAMLAVSGVRAATPTFATEGFVRGAHTNAKAYTDSVAATKQNNLPSTSGKNGKVLGVTDGFGTLGWVDQSETDTSGKADKAVPAQAGNVAVLNSSGNLADGGALGTAAFAATSDFDAAGAAATAAGTVQTNLNSLNSTLTSNDTIAKANTAATVAAAIQSDMADLTSSVSALDARLSSVSNDCSSGEVMTSDGAGGFICNGATSDSFVE